MHEFSLAQSIIDLVTESAQAQGIQQVRRVTVVVGEWSAVLPDALSTSFAVIAGVSGDLLEGAAMAVIARPATARCAGCEQEFAVARQGLFCPACGSAAELLTGTEFYVDSYEGE